MQNKNKGMQKAISNLSCLKALKDFIHENDISVEDAVSLLQENKDNHDDEIDASYYAGRMPLLANFKKWPYGGDTDDEDDVPAGRSALSYKGIFYQFNSATLFPQGRQAFMSHMGIQVLGQQSVIINFTVPVMGNGWRKVEYQGNPSSKQTVTDPFARWEYNIRSFQQSLSVLTFQSSYQVPKGYVAVRELLGAFITINRGLETLDLVNLNAIFPGASLEDCYPGQPGGKNSGIDAPNLFRDMETQYIQNKSYIMGRNHKIYFATQIPDQNHMYELLDACLNPAKYPDPQVFETNALRLDDHALYNDIVLSEPSNLQFQYDNASTEAQQALQQIQGVVKVMDDEKQEEFDLQAGYEYKANTAGLNKRDGFYPVTSNLTKTLKYTRKSQQGESYFVNLTANDQKMRLNLMQNTMIIQADTFFQPGLKPLTADGKVNGQLANYKDLYSNWCFLMEAVGDPNYTVELMFSNNAMPNDTYQLLTGVTPGSEVTFESSVETAVTTFGTTFGHPVSKGMTTSTIKTKSVESKTMTKDFQQIKNSTEYIKHAHRKALILKPNTLHSTLHVPTVEARKAQGCHISSQIMANGYLYLLEQLEYLITTICSTDSSEKAQQLAYNVFKRLNTKCEFIGDHHIILAQIKDLKQYEQDMPIACESREKYLRRVVLEREIHKAKQNRQALIQDICLIYKYIA